MIELLNGLDESIEGGIHKVAQGYGMLGLIRFTQSYYLCLITKMFSSCYFGWTFHLSYRRNQINSIRNKL